MILVAILAILVMMIPGVMELVWLHHAVAVEVPPGLTVEDACNLPNPEGIPDALYVPVGRH
jgi:hypothetical protein